MPRPRHILPVGPRFPSFSVHPNRSASRTPFSQCCPICSASSISWSALPMARQYPLPTARTRVAHRSGLLSRSRRQAGASPVIRPRLPGASWRPVQSSSCRSSAVVIANVGRSATKIDWRSKTTLALRDSFPRSRWTGHAALAGRRAKPRPTAASRSPAAAARSVD